MVKDFNCFVDRNDENLNRVQQAGGELDRIWGKMLTSLSGTQDISYSKLVLLILYPSFSLKAHRPLETN